MKKRLIWFLVVLMLLGSCPALAEDTSMVTIAGFPPVEDTIGIQAGTQITVGTATPMSGYFATDMWGTNTADMDVRALLHGYATVAWTRTLGLAINGTVVTGMTAEAKANGNRVYTVVLAEDILYNNGTPITAEDYVFSVLLGGAPEVAQIGGTPLGMDHIVGYADYMKGASKSIAGVRLLSNNSFSLEIDGKYLPFFYGLGMLNITPYPMSVIAPGCMVEDTEAGVRISAAPEAASMSTTGLSYVPGEFSVDMLRETLLNPDTGYVFNPKVTSGPYALESYDKTANVATFVVNQRYLGNYERQKPHIERVIFKHVANGTMFDEYLSGKVDILNKVANGAAIDTGILIANEQGQAQFTPYLRTGLTYLAFACEEGPTASAAVRKAIAYCIDKRAFSREIVGSTYGLPVFGYYGLGQWMYNQRFEANAESGLPALDTQGAVEALEIPFDLSIARSLLENDGWTLNAQGQPFAEGTDTVRYRDNGGQLEALTIKWAKTEGSAIADLLEQDLAQPFAALGIGLEITVLPFESLLTHYYRQTARTYNMFFLASNFNYIFDPYYDFNVADEFQGMVNASGLKDEELMQRAWDMRDTAPANMHEYAVKWIAFQERFVEVMPMVPLYSNLYYDFYAKNIQEYNIAQHSGWALALPYAYIGDAPAEAATEVPTETLVDNPVGVANDESWVETPAESFTDDPAQPSTDAAAGSGNDSGAGIMMGQP